MTSEYTFAKYDLSDLGDLSDLYSLVMGRNGDEHYFDWKYRQNPAGHAICVEGRDKRGQLASFYGMIPESYSDGNEQFLVYQGCDLMTHPDHRGKRLFPSAFKACCEVAQGDSSQFNFIGFGGPATLSGYKRLGLEFPVWARQMAKPILPLRPNKRRKVNVAAINAIEEISRLEGSLAHPRAHPMASKQLTREVLEWKAANPQREYHYVVIDQGFAILSKMGKRAQLVHARTGSGKATKALRYELNQWARSNKVQFLTALSNPDSWFRELLSGLGFLLNPFRKGPMVEAIPLMTWSVGDQKVAAWSNCCLSPVYFDSY